MFTLDTVFRAVPGVEESASGLTIAGRHSPFNDTARQVWRAFDGARTLREVIRTIAHDVGLDESLVRLDVERITALLRRAGALEVVVLPRGDCLFVDVTHDDWPWSLARWVRGGPPPRLAVDPTGFTARVTEARRSRTGGMVLGIAAACHVDLSRSQEDTLVGLHAEYAAVSQYLEGRLLDVSALLVEASIEHRVLKGLAHARLDYPRWEFRSFGDIDLLVPRSDLGRAAEVLLAAGARPYHAAITSRDDPRTAKALTVVFEDAPRAEIDLHADLVAGPFGVRMDPSCLFEQSRPLRISGFELDALSVSDAFVHACYTAIISNWTLKPLALLDVVQLAAQEPDSDRVWRLARAWRGASVVTWAAAAAAGRFPADRELLARWMKPPGRLHPIEQVAIRLDAAPSRRPLAREALTAILQPGIARKYRYVRSRVGTRVASHASLWARFRRAARARGG